MNLSVIAKIKPKVNSTAANFVARNAQHNNIHHRKEMHELGDLDFNSKTTRCTFAYDITDTLYFYTLVLAQRFST
jgi:hypothetical protein